MTASSGIGPDTVAAYLDRPDHADRASRTAGQLRAARATVAAG